MSYVSEYLFLTLVYKRNCESRRRISTHQLVCGSSMSPNRATGALLLALIVLPQWTTSAAGTPQSGQLTGTVKNALNAPIAEVTITVRGPVSQVARTDVNGRFDVPGLVEGDYELSPRWRDLHRPGEPFASRQARARSSR